MSLKLIHDSLEGDRVAIGVDQSLTGFGLTIISVDDHTKYRSMVFKSQYSGVQRLQNISDFLWEQWGRIVDEDDTVFVDAAMEGTVLASQSALVLGELSAVVKLAFYDFFQHNAQVVHTRVDGPLQTPLQVPPMTLKKYASGKGTSKKNEMLLKIYQRFGTEFDDDNAADSYALACLAAKHSPDAISQSVIDQVTDPKYRDVIQ